jgi:putative transposase
MRNPVIRYLYAIISFLLKNIWIVLLWTRFSPVQQGPRTIDMRSFRFELFILLVWDYVASSLKMVRKIPAYRYSV